MLWSNVQSRMNALYGKDNLTRLASESGIGPGTATRIKDQATSVGIDVLEKISTTLKVAPWQLLHPTLGVQSDDGSISVMQHAISPEAAMLATMLDTIKDPIERLKIMSACVNVVAQSATHTSPKSPLARPRT